MTPAALLAEIDILRARAAAVALDSHPEPQPNPPLAPEEYAYLRSALAALRTQIEEKLREYWLARDWEFLDSGWPRKSVARCPYCNSPWMGTPTEGRLACSDAACGAIVLVGRCAVETRVPGPVTDPLAAFHEALSGPSLADKLFGEPPEFEPDR